MYYSFLYLLLGGAFWLAGFAIGFGGAMNNIDSETILAATVAMSLFNAAVFFRLGVGVASDTGRRYPWLWGVAFLLPMVGLIISIKADIEMAKRSVMTATP